MGLVDLKTDLKSLKFGKDRPFGGSSNQPYIQKPIPDELPASSPDFLLRNGFLNPVSSATDVVRLSKYFTDLKTPSGILFTLKQNTLSRTAVRTQASVGPLNDKIYLPTNTLAQAAGVSTGLHLNKQGGFGGVAEDLGFGATYVSRLRFLGTLGPLANRLVELYDSKIEGQSIANIPINNVSPFGGELLRYQGGPGAPLGIGQTKIKFAKGSPGIPSQIGPLRTGNNNLQIKLAKARGFISSVNQNLIQDYTPKLGVTYEYDASSTTNTNIIGDTLFPNPLSPGGTILNPQFNPQIYNQSPNGDIYIGPTGPEIDQSKLQQSILRPIPTIDYVKIAGIDPTLTISGKAASATSKYYLSANASGFSAAQKAQVLSSYPNGPNNTVTLAFDGTVYKKDNKGELLFNPNTSGPELLATVASRYQQGNAKQVSSNNSGSGLFKSTLGVTTGYQGVPVQPQSFTPNIYKSGSYITPVLDTALAALKNPQATAAQVSLNNSASGNFKPLLEITNESGSQFADRSFKLDYEPTLNLGEIGPLPAQYTQKSAYVASNRNDDSRESRLGLSLLASGSFKFQAPVIGAQLRAPSVYQDSGSVEVNTTAVRGGVGGGGASLTIGSTYTYTQQQLIDVSKENLRKVQDFRQVLREQKKLGEITPDLNVSAKAPSYTDDNIEKRTNLGDPGKPGRSLVSYTAGPVQAGSKGKADPLDKINALSVYKSTGVTTNLVKNDLVKFRIAAIDSNSPNEKEFLHFRAFLNSFSDSYTATWNPISYVGRGESFYSYNGFGRTISLGWTVAAQSKPELIAMYKKLNFLASNLAPDYSGLGYMRGPLVQLTVGGYIYEQVGFITGMTLDIPEESTWEIGINDTDAGNDATVKELPHMIKVTSFGFTPIHEFIPRKQRNSYGDSGAVQSYGPQQYIALAANEDATATNWNDIEQYTTQTLNR